MRNQSIEELTILSSRELNRCPQNFSIAASIFNLSLRSADSIEPWICSRTLTQTGSRARTFDHMEEARRKFEFLGVCGSASCSS